MRYDEGLFVEIHGLRQWISIRGEDGRNPVVLMIGGPGGGMAFMAPFLRPWEQHFTRVQWDQPHAGVTHAANRNQDAGQLTFERLVRDAIALIEFLSHRLNVAKVIVAAFSGGTIVGLQVAKLRPDLVAAYVGTGQIVDWKQQDAASYRMVLDQARVRDDRAAIVELETLGAPPYADTATDATKAKYAIAFTPAENLGFTSRQSGADDPHIPPGIVLEDGLAVATAAYDALRGEILAFNADTLGSDFDVPMIFLQGASDACTPAPHVQAYVQRIRAPHKGLVLIEGGGHSPWLMPDYLPLMLQSLSAVGPDR